MGILTLSRVSFPEKKGKSLLIIPAMELSLERSSSSIKYRQTASNLDAKSVLPAVGAASNNMPIPPN